MDINESLRYLKYMSDQDEVSRYNLDTVFVPEREAGPTNFSKFIITEISTTSKPITSTIKPFSVKPIPIITTLSTPKINFISCPICKNEFKENEIKLHLKEYIKNLLSKDTVRDKLEVKRQSLVFDKIKELVSKLTDIQVKELIDKIQKLIEKYREKFIDYIPNEIKEKSYITLIK
ncbi:522_t:CDS:2 [Racocetra persica]|uniref:522_t:CDS:1 n=1 Tax=Racocetra persica TaxID=160502 RepID=A0ACA9KTW1_9GLOM|nr:522_t:CDS:2 [Racocetra persica]